MEPADFTLCLNARLGRDYLKNYHALRAELVSVSGSAFIRLSPYDQWILYAYYRHHERHSAAVCLEYRRRVSELNAPLPQQAGRAFARWLKIRSSISSSASVQIRNQVQGTSTKRASSKQFEVLAQARPDPDPVLLAKIVIDLAKYLEQDHESESASRESVQLTPWSEAPYSRSRLTIVSAVKPSCLPISSSVRPCS